MYEIYKIEMGETIDSIADKTKTTIENLKQINKTINIQPGEYIIVPTTSDKFFGIYNVKQGDNPYSIANQYGISPETLMTLNGLNKNDYIYPNQQLVVPNSDVDIYITKQGDTIDTIVEGLNTNYDTILDQNRKIYLLPDQLIVISKMNV